MDSPVPHLTPSARFAADFARVWPGPERIALAVSGGSDSLALLLLSHQTLTGRFEVAVVDHGLRAGSAAEADAVAAICTQRGIAHAILRPVVAASGNLQANARAARYAALGAWAAERGLAAVVTAHHADDQAETLLMRLSRGAGLRGLAAMREVALVPGHPALPLLRPLLGWRKAALAQLVTAAGLVAARDPANHDPRFERARVRDALAAAEWLDPLAVAASAGHLGEAEAVLEWAATREWAECVSSDGAALVYRARAPRALRMRVIERVVAALGAEGTPRGAEIARLDDALSAGKIATLGGVRAEPTADGWRLAPAPPRKTRPPA